MMKNSRRLKTALADNFHAQKSLQKIQKHNHHCLIQSQGSLDKTSPSLTKIFPTILKKTIKSKIRGRNLMPITGRKSWKMPRMLLMMVKEKRPLANAIVTRRMTSKML